MSANEEFEEIGYEPFPETTEDDSETVFHLMEEAGAARSEGDLVQVDKAFETIVRVKESGMVDQQTVEALEAFGLGVDELGYTKAMFTAEPSSLCAQEVIDSLEGATARIGKKMFVKAGRSFTKALSKSFATASDAVKLMLDNTSGMKPAIDFSVRRLDTLHSELKKVIDERGGWPTMGHEMLEDPSKPLDPYFLRDNIDKGLGAFVKRRAAASLINQLNGKRPSIEGQIITRPEYIQRTIDSAGTALHKAVQRLNAVADLKTITNKPEKIRPNQDDVHRAISDLSSYLVPDNTFETGEPEDYQNFARIADTIDGAMKSIANAKLVGKDFTELASRIGALEKDLISAEDDPNINEESLHAWEVLVKNMKSVSELYSSLAQIAHHVEHVADLFYRVLINARRDMVMAVEIAAEQAPGMDAKRLMMLSDREKEKLIDDQDTMRSARKKAQAKRNVA